MGPPPSESPAPRSPGRCRVPVPPGGAASRDPLTGPPGVPSAALGPRAAPCSGVVGGGQSRRTAHRVGNPGSGLRSRCLLHSSLWPDRLPSPPASCTLVPRQPGSPATGPGHSGSASQPAVCLPAGRGEACGPHHLHSCGRRTSVKCRETAGGVYLPPGALLSTGSPTGRPHSHSDLDSDGTSFPAGVLARARVCAGSQLPVLAGPVSLSLLVHGHPTRVRFSQLRQGSVFEGGGTYYPFPACRRGGGLPARWDH